MDSQQQKIYLIDEDLQFGARVVMYQFGGIIFLKQGSD